MTPREMLIDGCLAYNFPGNCRKRIDRIDKLAAMIGATVSYGLNTLTNSVEYADKYYEAVGLRQTETLLRYLKRIK